MRLFIYHSQVFYLSKRPFVALLSSSANYGLPAMMRRIRSIPKTDVDKLLSEVLSRGPLAALPKNLPDRWLRALGRDIARAQKANLEGRPEDPDVDVSAPLLVVASFLTAARGIAPEQFAMSSLELKDGMDRFGEAICNEIIGRETGVYVQEFTLENIV